MPCVTLSSMIKSTFCSYKTLTSATLEMERKKFSTMGFPSGSVIKKKSFFQCRRHRLDPWSRKISPAAEKTKAMCLNRWACALEPMSSSYWAHEPQRLRSVHPRAFVLQREKPPQWEAHSWQLESSPHSPQLEKKNVQQQRPSTVKNN